jgi:hypothetical protein
MVTTKNKIIFYEISTIKNKNFLFSMSFGDLV